MLAKTALAAALITGFSLAPIMASADSTNARACLMRLDMAQNAVKMKEIGFSLNAAVEGEKQYRKDMVDAAIPGWEAEDYSVISAVYGGPVAGTEERFIVAEAVPECVAVLTPQETITVASADMRAF